jgi:dihydroxyacetone kinase-like predicted kinase
MPNYSKFAFGPKERIGQAVDSGKVNERDLLLLDNGEMGWVAADKSVVINTPRTQESITVTGASAIGIEDGTVIEAGKNLDDLAVEIFNHLVPEMLKYINGIIGNEGGDLQSQLDKVLSAANEYTDNKVEEAVTAIEF